MIFLIKVRGLVWSSDDFRLVSCGLDGAIYEWNIVSSRREKECVLKSCSYTSIALSLDMKTTYAVGSDQTLKEMNLAESQVCIHHDNLSRVMYVCACTNK